MLRLLMLSVLLGASLEAAGAQENLPLSTGSVTLQDVLQTARESNPEIVSSRAAWQAAQARVRPAGAWPDPLLSFSKEKTPGGDKMNHLKVEQDIPFPGKLSAEARMAHHQARIAESNYRAKALEILAEARILYYRLYKTDRMIALLARNVDVVKSVLRLAQARSVTAPVDVPPASGMGGATPSAKSSSMGLDVFGLQAEVGRMENMLFEAQQERTLIQIELNALLNRPVQAPLGEAAAPELVPLPLGLPELLALAEKNDPMYLATLHEQKHAKAMLARARLGFAPDLGVMYDRQTMDGLKGYEAGVSLSVPLWLTRPWGEHKEAKAHIREAEAMAQAMKNDVMKMVSMEFTETNTHFTLAKNYETAILPYAESAFKLARRHYESGRGDFLRLLESARALIDAQNEYYNQLYHYGEHWALLEQWVGTPLAPENFSTESEQEKSHEHE